MALTVLATMAAAIYLLDFDRELAVTTSFCTLAFAQMWHVFNMRDESRHIQRAIVHAPKSGIPDRRASPIGSRSWRRRGSGRRRHQHRSGKRYRYCCR